MSEVELTEDTLLIHVRALDQLFALRSRLEIPLPTFWARRSIPRAHSPVGGRASGPRALRYRGCSQRAPSTRTASGCSGTCTIRRKRSLSGLGTSATSGSL